MKNNKAGGGFGLTKRYSITFLFDWKKVGGNYQSSFQQRMAFLIRSLQMVYECGHAQSSFKKSSIKHTKKTPL